MIRRLAILSLLTACGGVPKEVCKNKLDDDGNGLADCEDPACFESDCIEVCDDFEDNNNNGLLDCADPQCDGRGCAELCSDGRDNDWNGLVDCADAACAVECDEDEDGFATVEGGGDDCNDRDPTVYPGAPELCDGVDNNCNGLTDRADPDIVPSEVTLWFRDADGDGYGDPQNALYECDQPYGRVENGDDCDDEDPETNPLTPEICNGLDDNCDELIDDQDPLVDLSGASTWYVDNDGDGLGVDSYTQIACNRPIGYADNADDCDDTTTGILGASMWHEDADGDGFGGGVALGPYGCTPPGADYTPDYAPYDCDETDTAINPAAYEICGDLVDSDCDGSDCSVWKEDFESGSVSNVWQNGGNATWIAQAAVVHDGAFAGENGNIGDAQQSWIRATVDFPSGGDVTFWHSGSTESGWDFFEVRVDGVLLVTRSGTWAWTFESLQVAPGTHVIEFKYVKDGSVSSGADSVWLDDVILDGGTP